MTPIATALRRALATLERRGLLTAGLAPELAIAAALEAARLAARGNAAVDVQHLLEVADQIDAAAVRDFGAATTDTRGRVIKRLLGNESAARHEIARIRQV